jgi:DUF2911 family protein
MSLSVFAAAALAAAPVAQPPAPQPADTACQVLHPDRVPVAGRKSPLDSLTFTVARSPIKLCYGRPSARGRVMLGGAAVPYGKLWRTGANEPTIFFTPVAIRVAGILVPAGKYSLYTVPDRNDWEVIVNRSTTQWGEEHNYTAAVQAQEVGRAKVKTEPVKQPIETFTIRSARDGRGATLILEWETTRVWIPVKPA